LTLAVFSPRIINQTPSVECNDRALPSASLQLRQTIHLFGKIC
jgi:hypothetical protein